MTPKTSSESDFTEFLMDVMKNEKDQDIYIVPKYEAKQLLTSNRLQLIEQIREETPNSMRELSRKVNRDIKNVSKDLEVLKEYGIIEYKKEANRKIPELTAEKIIIEPL